MAKRWKILILSLAALAAGATFAAETDGSFNVSAQSVLPPPARLPEAPSFGPLKRDGAKGISLEEWPIFTAAGALSLDIDLAKEGALEYELLKISAGKEFSFFPAEVYQIHTPDSAKGHKEHLIVRMGERKVLFSPKMLESGDGVEYESTNFPGFRISREGSSLAMLDMKTQIVRTFASDDGGTTWRLMSVRDGRVPFRTLSCEYSRDGQMTGISLPGGAKYSIQHKGGAPAKVVDPDGAETSIDWDATGHLRRMETSLPPSHPLYPAEQMKLPGKRGKPFVMRSLHFECDSKGQILSLRNSFGEAFTAEYKVDTDRKTKVETRESVVKFPDGVRKYCRVVWAPGVSCKQEIGLLERDKSGAERRVSEYSADYKPKSNVYVMKEVSRNGAGMKFEHEGNFAAETDKVDVAGRQSNTLLDSHGLLFAQDGPGGSRESFKHDQEGRLIEKKDSMERPSSMKYDEKGLLAEVAEKGGSAKYEWNGAGLPVKTTLPDGLTHSFEWDGQGRLASHSQPGGVKTLWKYVGRSPLLASVETVAPDGTSRRTAYDYDPCGRLLKAIGPDGACEEANYDSGSLVMLKSKAGAMKCSYDAGRRKAFEQRPDGKKTVFSYDAVGRLVKTSGPSGTESVEYGQSGARKVVKADGRTLEYGVDGKIAGVIYPDGVAEKREFDAAGRLVAVRKSTGEATLYKYDEDGQRVAKTSVGRDGSSKTERKVYDQDGRLSKIESANGRTTAFYYLKGSDRLLGKVESGTLERYKYDAAGRVSAVAKYPVELHKAATTQEEKDALFEKYTVETRLYDSLGKPPSKASVTTPQPKESPKQPHALPTPQSPAPAASGQPQASMPQSLRQAN